MPQFHRLKNHAVIDRQRKMNSLDLTFVNTPKPSRHLIQLEIGHPVSIELVNLDQDSVFEKNPLGQFAVIKPRVKIRNLYPSV